MYAFINCRISVPFSCFFFGWIKKVVIQIKLLFIHDVDEKHEGIIHTWNECFWGGIKILWKNYVCNSKRQELIRHVTIFHTNAGREHLQNAKVFQKFN